MPIIKVPPEMIKETGNPIPVPGSKMKIGYLFQDSTYPLEDLGGYWPVPKITEAYFGVNKEYTAADGSTDAPSISHLVAARSNGSPADVVAQMLFCSVEQDDGVAFGQNIIIGNVAQDAKMVGMEIDIQPSTGSTVIDSAGIFLNAFTVPDAGGDAIGIYGIFGGNWVNGVKFNGISGTCLSTGVTTTTNFIDTTQGSFVGPTVYFGQGDSIAWQDSGFSPSVVINTDTNDNIQIFAPAVLTTKGTGVEGDLITSTRFLSNDVLNIFAATGNYGNVAATALNMRRNSVTSRSINAGGTINASGADYAEYETKRSDCGNVTKGQIIGFDKDGLVTDKWADAISFAVKSTNPNIVGGDTWHTSAGEPPVAPMPPKQPPLKPEKPKTTRSDFAAQIEEEHQKSLAQWEKDLEAHAKEQAKYEAAYAEYQAAYTKWQEKYEETRNTVDRIAYCGKVPVNVLNASIGDYIVPAQDGQGIKGVAVASPTFEQYQLAIGRVRKILGDGRAEIVVKSI